jgi:threonine/homoserine/homoserine lactone efflux protein
MFDIENYASFIAAIVVFQLIPGPGTLAILNATAKGGFMAFFPLFLRPGAPALTLVTMMLHVSAISLAYQMTLVLAGNAAARRLARWPLARRVATRLAGIALIGFGARLALDR